MNPTLKSHPLTLAAASMVGRILRLAVEFRMKRARVPAVLAAAALIAAMGAPAPGALAAMDGWSLTVRAENDLPANSDRYYSNGASAAFARCIQDSDSMLPAILRLPGMEGPGLLGLAFDLGQVMVTPADTQLTVPDPRDRPYAGLLYAGVSWQRLKASGYTAVKLLTGVVGPAAIAEPTQKAVHRLTGSPEPRGWDHQLRGEPILNAVYERRWRAAAWGNDGGWGGDALFIGGGTLGNVLTQGYAHAQLRFGWHVPRDFGTSLIRGVGALPPARDAVPWGAHAFASLGGFGVARNVTLDGNSFRDGPGVERRPWVPSAEAGVVWRGHTWQVAASWVFWGREFTGQPRHSEFGTLALTLFR